MLRPPQAERPSRVRPRPNPKRKRLYHLDPRCFYCKRVLLFEESTLDHVIAKAKGGSNGIDNLVLSCMPCNNKKGDMDQAEFIEQMNNSAV